MPDSVHEIAGTRLLVLDPAGPPIVDRAGVLDMIGMAAGAKADIVAIPVERQGDAFFDLKTRIAGEVLQTCVTYHLRVAFVGDLTERLAASGALRDFVRESNKGSQVWFVDDLAELERKLAAA